jgi:hypothetical protein
MSDYLKTFRKAVRKSLTCDISDLCDQSPPVEVNLTLRPPLLSHMSLMSQVGRSQKPFADDLAVLERRCPDTIEQQHWQQAVEDGRRLLATWGEQLVALGWTSDELFGLHEPPSNPHPSYNRLSRYDCAGLVWLLRGNPVVALTENTAAIRHKPGSITNYRKLNKPGLGPVGDSLDDFV